MIKATDLIKKEKVFTTKFNEYTDVNHTSLSAACKSIALSLVNNLGGYKDYSLFDPVRVDRADKIAKRFEREYLRANKKYTKNIKLIYKRKGFGCIEKYIGEFTAIEVVELHRSASDHAERYHNQGFGEYLFGVKMSRSNRYLVFTLHLIDFKPLEVSNEN